MSFFLPRGLGLSLPDGLEDTAQWKMLERKEKKAAKGHEALALQDPAVPEPGTILLLVAGTVFLLAARRRVRRPEPIR